MTDKYRDPIHGFIEVRCFENEIINSMPFQRLRNIKQLAMTLFGISWSGTYKIWTFIGSYAFSIKCF